MAGIDLVAPVVGHPGLYSARNGGADVPVARWHDELHGRMRCTRLRAGEAAPAGGRGGPENLRDTCARHCRHRAQASAAALRCVCLPSCAATTAKRAPPTAATTIRAPAASGNSPHTRIAAAASTLHVWRSMCLHRAALASSGRRGPGMGPRSTCTKRCARAADRSLPIPSYGWSPSRDRPDGSARRAAAHQPRRQGRRRIGGCGIRWYLPGRLRARHRARRR